jgi:hypothetical protein
MTMRMRYLHLVSTIAQLRPAEDSPLATEPPQRRVCFGAVNEPALAGGQHRGRCIGSGGEGKR